MYPSQMVPFGMGIMCKQGFQIILTYGGYLNANTLSIQFLHICPLNGTLVIWITFYKSAYNAWKQA